MKLFNILMSGTLFVSLTISSIATANSKKEEIAIKEAKKWVQLVDEKKYKDSWLNAASLFKSQVTQKQWGTSISRARKPFGKMIVRKLKSKRYISNVPGAPTGEYVIIQFTTAFEYKENAVETITPMLDKDNKWRVSGYYIK